jgi:hypothetical protein
MSRPRRPGRFPAMIAAVGILGALLGALHLAAAPGVVAAEPVRWGTPSSSQVFGQQVEVRQPVTVSQPLRRVEVLIRQPRSVGPHVSLVTPPAPEGSMTLVFDLGVVDAGLVPNTPLEVRWRLTENDGTVSLGPVLDVRYVDDRFHWQTATGSLVRLHWYAGDLAFGRRALQIGEDGVAVAETLLGVTETEPVDFFVYADQAAFYAALGPGTPENVGGEAFAEIRTMFALIPPDEVSAGWVGTVVPHELTHLVFDTATFNPYHSPPHWLNEGIATYVAQGYDPSSRDRVRSAIAAGTLMPLDALVGAFPLVQDRFYLAYAESVSAVDFLIRRYGTAALERLVRAYGTGASDDEAFRAALGVNVEGFQAAWLADLGAQASGPFGPQPAPPGPVPSDWLRAGGIVGPPGSAAPAQPAPTAGATEGTGPTAGSGSLVPALVGAVLALVIVGGILVLGRGARGGRGGRGGDGSAGSAGLPGVGSDPLRREEGGG